MILWTPVIAFAIVRAGEFQPGTKNGDDMISLGTLLFTWANGKLVGTDSSGNRYYEARSAAKGQRRKRWVLYGGAIDGSLVPAEWHAWLHYTSDKPLTGAPRREWQASHAGNQTGTVQAYLPPGHDLRGGRRDRAAGDYEAWQP
jgi:NADH:ubiquinone oxidoreductase subunit